MGKSLTHEEFIERLDEINPNREYEVIGKYKKIYDKILIKNIYGYCLIIPLNLIQGCNPNVQSAINPTEYFINQAKEVHGDKYDYSKVIYINMVSKVIIICPFHNEFLQTSKDHLRGRGCEKCSYIEKGKKLTSNYVDVINKANIIHNNKYNYSKFIYINCKIKGIIICPEHGEFLQNMAKHFNCKNACPICHRQNWGFNKSKFINLTDEANLYLIKCWNDKEEFYKIGITTQSIKYRFMTNVKMPYNYEIVLHIRDNNKNIYDLEKQLHKEYKSFKYKPQIRFSGETECFNLKEKQIKETIEKLK